MTPLPPGDDTAYLSVGGPKYRIDMALLHDDLADRLLQTVADLVREGSALA